MAIINPINLSKWLPNTPIIASQARAEFKNIYDLVNGNLDSANIKNNSITGAKLADGSITESKFLSIPASKITGRLAVENLPVNLLTTSGGSLSGTITFDVPESTPLLKNYDDEEIILFEGGQGDNKIKIIVGGTSTLKVVKGKTVMWELTTDGVDTPKAFKVPVV